MPNFKIFEREDRINFVDRNNVFVGFEYIDRCCEEYGWFFSDELNGEKRELPEAAVEALCFDRHFHAEITVGDGGGYDQHLAVFKLLTPDGGAVFLHIFNKHNGYYSHGFEFGCEKYTIRAGDL